MPPLPTFLMRRNRRERTAPTRLGSVGCAVTITAHPTVSGTFPQSRGAFCRTKRDGHARPTALLRSPCVEPLDDPSGPMGIRFVPQRGGDAARFDARRPTLLVTTDAGIVDARVG